MGFQQGFRINTNTSSLDTYRNYSASQAGMEKNIERLSSGLRINSASDDSAGLSISNRMDNQVRGMQQANRNVQQGNNLLQTAEGAMNEIGNILGRMRELAVQSASDTMNTEDRSSIDLEFEQLKAEITRIADSTEYNGEAILDGTKASTVDTANASGGTAISGNFVTANFELSAAQGGTYTIKADDDDHATATSLTIESDDGRSQTISFTVADDADDVTDGVLAAGKELEFESLGITLKAVNGAGADTALNLDFEVAGKTLNVAAGRTLQAGANNASDQQISFGLQNLASDGALSIDTADLSSLANSQTAINTLDAAIDSVNTARSNVGALQNRLEFTSSNLMNSIQNNAASMSTIRDADFAAEAADLAKNQILVQSGTAMLAQANGLSQNVLALIR
jgi:flagellin